MPKFACPKLTDRQLVTALVEVASKFGERFQIILGTGGLWGEEVKFMPNADWANLPLLKPLLDEESLLIRTAALYDTKKNGQPAPYALQFTRENPNSNQPDLPTDLVTAPDEQYRQHHGGVERDVLVPLVAAVRRNFRVIEFESAFAGLADKEWGRYLESQRSVLTSLQTTTQRLLVDAAEAERKSEQEKQARYSELEKKLKDEVADERKKLLAEHEQRTQAHAEKEAHLAKRLEAFQTKEARYVARQKQEEQIKELNDWREKWSLTKETAKKRWPVALAYLGGAAVSLSYASFSAYSTFEILKSPQAVQTLALWQWLLLSLKTMVPFAFFASLLVYFIRWTSAWARQHAEEEFRNRARIVGVGRASWLLEAVRDAQEHKTEIPPVLLQELARNLFVFEGSQDGDIHPKAADELFWQGMTSIKAKAGDGELELTRKRS